MSRLFYHVCQDNAGNLLFDVTGTMRLAGSGTLATIYGDEALTVILPNPMTNHPSFASFKCFLGAGDYDFYLAKSGYTFETLTGVQGHGTMAQQNANAVAITGGTAVLSDLDVNGNVIVSTYVAATTGIRLGDTTPPGVQLDVVGNGRLTGWLASTTGLRLGGVTAPQATTRLHITHPKASIAGVIIAPSDADTGAFAEVLFTNLAGSTVGSIATTGAATAYNTSSDARLKHAITPLTGALDVIRRTRPITHLWNADGSRGYSFLAHELQQALPPDAGVVSGEPDAVNEDGSIRPQQVDNSKLVPWLTACCQELAAQVETLLARVQSLETQLGV